MTYYANLSGTFPKIARNKTALSITMSLIAGRYSQNLVGAEFAWTTDTYIAMIGSTSSIKKGIIQPKYNYLWFSNGNSWIKASRISRLVSREPWKQETVLSFSLCNDFLTVYASNQSIWPHHMKYIWELVPEKVTRHRQKLAEWKYLPLSL